MDNAALCRFMLQVSIALLCDWSAMLFVLCVLFEVANLINERPIDHYPRSPEDGSYLCPNDLLLGRSTTKVPSGPFKESTNPRLRFELWITANFSFKSRQIFFLTEGWRTCKSLSSILIYHLSDRFAM